MAINCIVDDSALLAGLGADAKYSIKQWVDDGAINAFVPLYTLERLNNIRESNSNRRDDAQKALEWLDTLTSKTYKKTTGRVQLQGPDDQYPTWRDVERYILPDTPFSSRGSSNDLSRTFERDLSLNVTQAQGGIPPIQQLDGESPSPNITGAVQQESEPAKTKRRRGKSGSPNGVPQRVRPLINFVVWRSHHEEDGIDGPGHYILLTDDVSTQRQAQKFGIRAKRMSQVSSIVARDAGKRSSASIVEAVVVEDGDEDDDDDIGLPPDERPPQEEADDEIFFDPSKRPQSSRSMNVLDPNSFGRQPIKAPIDAPMSPPPRPPKAPSNHHSRGQGSGSRGKRGQRGQGNSTRGAGNVAKASQGPTVPLSPRQQTRNAAIPIQEPVVQGPSKPIDPDSYARNIPGSKGRGRGRGRGRGGDRGRLWEPS